MRAGWQGVFTAAGGAEDGEQNSEARSQKPVVGILKEEKK
jgi:hypothetical protein